MPENLRYDYILGMEWNHIDSSRGATILANVIVHINIHKNILQSGYTP